MTDEEIAAIRERAAKATPAPWVDSGRGHVKVWRRRSCEPVGEPVLVHHLSMFSYDPYYLADAAFIAHAREDVARLLDEVERLRGQLATMEAVIERAGEADVAVSGRLTALETENAALREVARAVVATEPTYWDDYGDTYCVYCILRESHEGDCPFTKARKMLGMEG